MRDETITVYPKNPCNRVSYLFFEETGTISHLFDDDHICDLSEVLQALRSQNPEAYKRLMQDVGRQQ